MKKLFYLLFVLLSTTIWAQKGEITGVVTDESEPVAFATVTINDSVFTATSDEKGRFRITEVPYGKYHLSILGNEHEPYQQIIHLNQSKLDLGKIKIKPNVGLEEVVILAQSKVQQVKEQPFAVESIDMKPLQNRNLNVNQVLNQSTGVRIRETGGLGSDFVFSLSGFTGNQVRFFVDGLPTEVLGSAYNINSIPVNNVERIEIYKGVVPIHLGSDVLGGAVNIVTNNSLKSYLDVSYGFGSFNTHQSSIVGRYAFKNGFLVNASAFYNYSDNSFKIATYLYDKESGKKDEFETNVKRFNDAFKSATGNMEFGIVNKRFADRLMFGLIATTNYKEIQNGANMTVVAGDVYTTEKGFIPTLKFEKSNFLVKNLSLKISALYSNIRQQNVDTSSREYDWTGAYVYKTLSNYSGELNWYKTMFTFTDQNTFGMSTLSYKPGRNHTFTLNNTFSRMERVGSDPIKMAPIPYDDPNILSKNFLGLSYQAKFLNDKLTATAFGKLFNMSSLLYKEVYLEEEDENVIQRSENTQQLPGFGAAASYFVLSYVQLKASYENTYRLPEGYELFGDGLLLLANPDLVPEKSQNFNTGFLFGKRFFKDHLLNLEFNYLYRLPTNLIRSVAMGVTSQYQNLGNAEIHCFESSVTYKYKRWLSLEWNGTLQNIRNTALKTNGEPDLLYGDRLPNTPYLFSNAAVSITTKPYGKSKSVFGFSWNASFIEEFYLKWESQGSADSKFVIPRQLVNNAAFTYSSHNGRYNVSVACMNVFDARCYDNFRIQKPGRSFNIKLRYYLSK